MKDLPQVGVLDGVEELPDIDLDDPSACHAPCRVLDCPQCLMSGATRTKTIREVVKLLLVDGLQHHVHRSLQAIRALGKKAGVTMNPGTPVSSVEDVIDMVDLILVMSVNPGFGGQAFIPAALDKINDLRALVGARPIDIEVDGGITAEIAPRVVQAGANVLVAGSAVFKGGNLGGNYKANIAAIRNAAAMARGEAA